MRSVYINKGFTLIEIMVVLVLIGIVSVFAMLSVGEPSEEKLRVEAERLTALIQLASDEALLKSREYGVVFSDDGYRFVVYEPSDERRWVPLDEGVFRQRKLDDGVSLQLLVDGLSAELTSKQNSLTPQVVLFSGGGKTAFELNFLYQGEAKLQLTGEYFGEPVLQWKERG